MLLLYVLVVKTFLAGSLDVIYSDLELQTNSLSSREKNKDLC
jgi:hypothetical protein